MKLKRRGKSTSGVEVCLASGKGLWVMVRDEEFFLPFDRYPWFRDARVADLFKVQLDGPGHLFWPLLDVDLELESLRHPDQYPLVYR